MQAEDPNPGPRAFPPDAPERAKSSAGLPPGKARRLWSLSALGVGTTLAFLLMAADRRFAFGALAGTLAIFVATLGGLGALGTFDDEAAPQHSTSLRKLWAPLSALALGLSALVGALRLAVSGVLPAPIHGAAVLVTGSCLAVLLSGYWLLRRLGALDRSPLTQRPLEHHGAWLLAIGIVLYVPRLGSYSLIDPWETHYGEVAREMLTRNDWISFWWAQEGWFFSKPAFTFWIQGLSFLVLGVRFEPDQMLAGAAEGHFPQPEWAARIPVIALALLAIYLSYRAVARVYGRRAGFLGGLVLTTAPYWFFIAHQSMTDMPYVAPLTGALALVALGLHADPEHCAPSYEIRLGNQAIRVSVAHVLLAMVIATALPQILYLLSRNLTLVLDGPDPGFNVHRDVFFRGSGGANCGLPGNEACLLEAPANPVFQPALAAFFWSIALGLFLLANRDERRVSRLCFLGAWYLTALALLAKGAPGLVLPLLITGVVLGANRRFRDLPRLELPGLMLLLCCVALPWYVQAFMRHGPAFTDRLLFHDMYKRAFLHVHDTNLGDDVSFGYYLWQLGYGLFPWTGLAALGLVLWFREPDSPHNPRGELSALLGLWAVLGFSMFTVSLTKFHHYALPIVPPLCLLTGIVLDRLLEGSTPKGAAVRRVASLAALVVAALLLVLGVTCFGDGSFFGTVLDGKAAPAASPAKGISLVLAGLLTFSGSLGLWPRNGMALTNGSSTAARFDSASLGLIGLLAAGAVAWVGRDLYTQGNVEGQARLLHLFTYNYARSFPRSLDFEATLRAFSLVFAATCALIAVPRLRAHAVRLACATSIVFSAFALNVYLVKTAPHWGQRETILAYYATRSGSHEPLIAYQMNWKGENFYTGNRLPAFVSSGEKFKEFMRSQREQGVRVVYFTTEHSRANVLQNELGKVKSFSILTKPELNDKFFLARVEL